MTGNGHDTMREPLAPPCPDHDPRLAGGAGHHRPPGNGAPFRRALLLLTTALLLGGALAQDGPSVTPDRLAALDTPAEFLDLLEEKGV